MALTPLQGFKEALLEETPQQALSRNKREKQTILREIYKNSDVPKKDYLDYETACIAYEYILEHGVDKWKALAYAISVNNKPEEWLNKGSNGVMHRNFLHAKKIVEEYEKHPSQQSIKENTEGLLTGIKSANTPSKLLGKIYKGKTLSDKIDNLREEVDHLKDKSLVADKSISNLNGLYWESREQIESMSICIQTLKKDIQGIDDRTSLLELGGSQLNEQYMEPKERAKLLRSEGRTLEQVAILLNKNEKTIRRWTKEEH